MAEEKKMSVGVSELKELIEAIRNPAKTEKQIREEEAAKADRAALAATMKAAADLKRQNQEACSHMRSNGTTTAVLVHDGGAGYLLCQVCQLSIYGHERPELFNKLIQLAI